MILYSKYTIDFYLIKKMTLNISVLLYFCIPCCHFMSILQFLLWNSCSILYKINYYVLILCLDASCDLFLPFYRFFFIPYYKVWLWSQGQGEIITRFQTENKMTSCATWRMVWGVERIYVNRQIRKLYKDSKWAGNGMGEGRVGI